MDGISINDPRYASNLIYVKTPQDIGMAHDWGRCGYGILYTVAPYEIWFKQAMSLWAEYQQLFGVPIRLGKTDTRNEQMRGQMAEMLANMGAKAWGVFDLKDNIELIAPNNVNGTLIFDPMIERQQKLISKIILGHADAIDSIPGKLGNSGEESPSEKAMEDIETFDCSDVEFELEKNVVPKLVALGFPMPKGSRICFNNSHEKIEARVKEDVNNKATADIIKLLSDANYEVDEKYITERTGIPVKKKEEQTVSSQKKVANELKNKLDIYYGSECGHSH
jgi:phage gp29-like protein